MAAAVPTALPPPGRPSVPVCASPAPFRRPRVVASPYPCPKSRVSRPRPFVPPLSVRPSPPVPSPFRAVPGGPAAPGGAGAAGGAGGGAGSALRRPHRTAPCRAELSRAELSPAEPRRPRITAPHRVEPRRPRRAEPKTEPKRADSSRRIGTAQRRAGPCADAAVQPAAKGGSRAAHGEAAAPQCDRAGGAGPGAAGGAGDAPGKGRDGGERAGTGAVLPCPHPAAILHPAPPFCPIPSLSAPHPDPSPACLRVSPPPPRADGAELREGSGAVLSTGEKRRSGLHGALQHPWVPWRPLPTPWHLMAAGTRSSAPPQAGGTGMVVADGTGTVVAQR